MKARRYLHVTTVVSGESQKAKVLQAPPPRIGAFRDALSAVPREPLAGAADE